MEEGQPFGVAPEEYVIGFGGAGCGKPAGGRAKTGLRKRHVYRMGAGEEGGAPRLCKPQRGDFVHPTQHDEYNGARRLPADEEGRVRIEQSVVLTEQRVGASP